MSKEGQQQSSQHPYFNAVPSGEYGPSSIKIESNNPYVNGSLNIVSGVLGATGSIVYIGGTSGAGFALFASYSAGFGYNTPNFKLLGLGATFDVYDNYGTGSLFDGISGPTMDYSAGYYLMGGKSIPLNQETGKKDTKGVFKTSGGFGTGVNIGQSKTRRLL